MMGNRVTNQSVIQEETPVVVPEETPVIVPEETPVIVPEETPVVVPEETPVVVPEEKLLEVFPDPLPEEPVQRVKVDTADDAIEYLTKTSKWNEFRERRDMEHKKAQTLMRSFMDSLMTDPDVFGRSKPISEPLSEHVSEPIEELTLKTALKKPRVVFICDRKIMCYFEDYINTFHNIFEVSIFLFTAVEMIDGFLGQQIIAGSQRETFYIFMQFVPPNVMEKLNLYIAEGFKMGIFNTEQLSKKEHAWMINCQHPFFYRVDYSEVNLLVIANEMNHKKIYLPYQVHPREIRSTEVVKDRGVCIIYPYKSERRYKIINDLKAKGIQVDEISGFQEARDAELFRYKVLLNVHFADDYNVFEEMRCVRAVFNQMIVISEKSWYDDLHILRRHFLVCDYDQIVAKVVDVVVNYNLYHSHLFRSFDRLMPVYDADLQAIALENIAKVV
jgi:hypothetical protein